MVFFFRKSRFKFPALILITSDNFRANHTGKCRGKFETSRLWLAPKLSNQASETNHKYGIIETLLLDIFIGHFLYDSHKVFELTAHLVYWAKATVIFPICLTNKYVIAPDAPIHLNSPLLDKFSESFPGYNLVRAISEFALPTSLGQKCNPLCYPSQQSHLIETIIWMLQHHLLLQLHTYIQYLSTDNNNAQQLRHK